MNADSHRNTCAGKLCQQWNIFFALAQRGKINADDVQAVEKIFAEFAFAHHLAKIDVGRSDDAHID